MANITSQAEKQKSGNAGTLEDYIRLQGRKIENLLPDDVDPVEFMEKLVTVITSDAQFSNPQLDKRSFKEALIKCATAGFIPNTSSMECHLTANKNGECKFMLGIGGKVTLASKAGLQVVTGEIRKNDRLSITRKLCTGNRFIRNFDLIEGFPDRGEVIAYYALYVNINDLFDSDIKVISKADIEAHVKRSFVGPSWKNHFGSMAENYCIKQLLRNYQFNLNGDYQKISEILHSENVDDEEVVETVLSEVVLNAEKNPPNVSEAAAQEPKKRGRKKKEPEPEIKPEQNLENNTESESEQQPINGQMSLLKEESSEEDVPF